MYFYKVFYLTSINKYILLDFSKDQNYSTSPLPNNRTISFNTTPKPIPKEHLKCNILKGNIDVIYYLLNVKYRYLIKY